MALLGPDTDKVLERMTQRLLDYHLGIHIDIEDIDGKTGIARELGAKRLNYWRDNTPLGLKYRCLSSIASSRERNLEDLYDWQYGIVSAFQSINFYEDHDQVLIALIRRNAARDKVNLFEKSEAG